MASPEEFWSGIDTGVGWAWGRWGRGKQYSPEAGFIVFILIFVYFLWCVCVSVCACGLFYACVYVCLCVCGVCSVFYVCVVCVCVGSMVSVSGVMCVLWVCCVCVCVCGMYLCVCVCSSECTYFWRSEANLCCCPLGSGHLSFWDGVSHPPLNLGWLPVSLRSPLVSAPPPPCQGFRDEPPCSVYFLSEFSGSNSGPRAHTVGTFWTKPPHLICLRSRL